MKGRWESSRWLSLGRGTHVERTKKAIECHTRLAGHNVWATAAGASSERPARRAQAHKHRMAWRAGQHKRCRRGRRQASGSPAAGLLASPAAGHTRLLVLLQTCMMGARHKTGVWASGASTHPQLGPGNPQQHCNCSCERREPRSRGVQKRGRKESASHIKEAAPSCWPTLGDWGGLGAQQCHARPPRSFHGWLSIEALGPPPWRGSCK